MLHKLSHEFAMYFTYQMFHYFHHGIVYFHLILSMRCIVYIIYQYRLILLSPNKPCGLCLLFVAGATLNKIYLIFLSYLICVAMSYHIIYHMSTVNVTVNSLIIQSKPNNASIKTCAYSMEHYYVPWNMRMFLLRRCMSDATAIWAWRY